MPRPTIHQRARVARSVKKPLVVRKRTTTVKIKTRPVGPARPVGRTVPRLRTILLRRTASAATAPRRTVARFVAARSRTGAKNSETRINQANRLAGPSGVTATGPPLDPGNLAWPPEINATFAISIRPLRYAGLRARLGPWARHVQHWNGTNGATIDIPSWLRSGKIDSNGAKLRRGEIGCCDSHVRLWEHIVARQIPRTLILEDDANLRHIRPHAQQLRKCFDELSRLKVKWHLLYLGRGSHQGEMGRWSAMLTRPKGFCGLFAYVLTLEGARLLLSKARPYRLPVDIYVANMHDTTEITAVAIKPRMMYVVQVHSDTVHIS